MTFFRKILATNAPAAVILIRLIVGAVFLSESVQKFLYADALGVGRFTKIGIPSPEVMPPFVGVFEIGCGALLLLGLLTRLTAIPLIVVMLVAHEARTDYAMLLGATFLLLVGAGPWSFDARLSRRKSEKG